MPVREGIEKPKDDVAPKTHICVVVEVNASFWTTRIIEIRRATVGRKPVKKIKLLSQRRCLEGLPVVRQQQQ